jgi:hypothetical protein
VVFEPEPETAAEAQRADAFQRMRREELTDMDIREAEIRAKWEAEDAAETAERREEEDLRRAAWDQRTRMLDQLRESPVLDSIKSDWAVRLEKNPTSQDLIELQADVAAFRTSGGPLREAVLGKFLMSFETEVDRLRRLCWRYEQSFS